MRFALILAGGSGTRLWPMSRSALPKQLIPFMDGKSLLQLSYSRLEGVVDRQRRFICASESLRHATLNELPGMPPENFLGEPCSRNTLNALAYAAAVISRIDTEAIIGVFTADAVIEPEERFRDIVSEAFALVERERRTLVTFGIKPSYAATGYGYLQLDKTHSDSARTVTTFREKPPQSTAEQWLAEGPERYLWNSGMFVWSASAFLDCVRRYEPHSFEGARRISLEWGLPGFAATIASIYQTLKSISVDHAIMERAAQDPSVRVVCLPMDLAWNDIGSWSSFRQLFPADASGNANRAEKSIMMDTTGTFVVSTEPDHLIAVLGCDNITVIHTPDATLICHRDMAERVKEIQALVAEHFGPQHV